MLRNISPTVIIIITIAVSVYGNNMRGPENFKKNYKQSTKPANLSSLYGYTFLKLYQTGLGKFIKSSCPMQPSCSHYSIEAITQYGLIRGVILTADRLLHETDEAIMVDKIWIKERGYCAIDPVNRNILWNKKDSSQTLIFKNLLKK